ncbi:glycosyltransferase family 4 protein [Salinimonas sediminis]|uniref:Glycosyltransferase family 1 protein n=1 Tax=Salinimonas sediminis TaxID=2303538 RepID=A0A346NMW1_9ALTE|nr:glycosyltransferase family 4 protein [Salinimonas sediminis]AXR06868.1 glycosyltransferase family 1 protein [Salinimonas sediminis]
MNKKRKIFVVGTAQVGGIDSVIKNLAICMGDNYTFKRIATHDAVSAPRKAMLFIRAFLQILYFSIVERKPIFHLHMSYNGSFWRKLIYTETIKLLGGKVVVHLHGSEFRDFIERSGRFTTALVNRLVKKADKFLVLSDYWADYIRSIVKKYSHNKIEVLRNFALVENKNGLKKQARNFLFVGAIIKRKGIYDLLNALKYVSNIHLHVCGDGELEECERLVNELGIAEKVKFHGWIDGFKKVELMEVCEALILPSYNEGLPIVILEAMQLNTPIITTPVGGIPEVIKHKETGYLVEPGNIKEIVEAINVISTDTLVTENIAKNAKALYENEYCHTISIPKLIHIYDQVA